MDAIFREFGKSTYPLKVGLYTSPHIKYVRERIQINSEPISEEYFTVCFFRLWDKITSGSHSNERPGYFRFLTLMSYVVFLEEEVTVSIYETGVGGEYDATNLVEKPLATGITSLGIDHERTLKVPADLRPSYFTSDPQDGATMEEIAWHKAGIFKSGCPAFSTQQKTTASHVLYQRAAEKGVTLKVVHVGPELSHLPSEHHKQNAALAVALADAFLDSNARTDSNYQGISRDILLSLQNTQVKGRCQSLKTGNDEWYIDGAHTKDSLIAVGRWYKRSTEK